MDKVMKYCKRIVGGGYVGEITNYPFMATLWYLDGDEFKFKCGATYIGKNFFLTAAHCIKNRNSNMTLIRMGSTYINGMPETMRVKKVYVHPHFNTTNLRNDIAIIEVEYSPKKYNPVRLPCNHLINVCYNIGSSVKVIGFGKDKDKSTQQFLEYMKEVDLKIKSLQETKYHSGIIGKDVFLAGDIKNGVVKDACTGDSGGPCLMKIKNNWVLVGIVSWGSGCGKEKLPGVYTKVLSYNSWIRRICKFPSCSNN